MTTRPNALPEYIEALVQATIRYEASGDHRHNGGPFPGDCIRCNLLPLLPDSATPRVRDEAERLKASPLKHHPRGWDDQPKLLERIPLVLHTSIEANVVEVRHGGGAFYYVTVGNLFGSQTIECDSADVAFGIIELVGKKKRSLSLPAGARLVPNE